MFIDVGERNEYADGAFCWAELTSTDQEAAEAFCGDDSSMISGGRATQDAVDVELGGGERDYDHDAVPAGRSDLGSAHSP
jgi:hypothetical protein